MTIPTDGYSSSRVHWHLYSEETPAIVVKFFEDQLEIMEAMKATERWRIHYGDRVTGRAMDIADEGYIHLGFVTDTDRTTLMLMHNKNSQQGKGIMMSKIIKIEPCSRQVNQGRPVYRHPTFFKPTSAIMKQDRLAADTDMRQHRGIVLRRAQ
jgi:hypothetical protein